MKKKAITIALLGLLAIGSIVPITAKAMERWDYGYNQDGMYNYNYYITSVGSHYVSMTKNGVTYTSPVQTANNWSKLHLAYTGPYAVYYNKYIIY